MHIYSYLLLLDASDRLSTSASLIWLVTLLPSEVVDATRFFGWAVVGRLATLNWPLLLPFLLSSPPLSCTCRPGQL